jgi:hypothetical protein
MQNPSNKTFADEIEESYLKFGIVELNKAKCLADQSQYNNASKNLLDIYNTHIIRSYPIGLVDRLLADMKEASGFVTRESYEGQGKLKLVEIIDKWEKGGGERPRLRDNTELIRKKKCSVF